MGSVGDAACVRALALTCAAWSALAHATPILDQSYVLDGGLGGFVLSSEQSLSQVFTVGIGGTLTQVGIQLYQVGDIGDVTLTIRPTVGGVPGVETLVTTVIRITDIPRVFAPPVPVTLIDVSAAHIEVAPGDQLAISLSRALFDPGFGPQVVWMSLPEVPAYAGGAAFTSFGQPPDTWRVLSDSGRRRSFGFQTFVERTVAGPGGAYRFDADSFVRSTSVSSSAIRRLNATMWWCSSPSRPPAGNGSLLAARASGATHNASSASMSCALVPSDHSLMGTPSCV